MNWEFLTSSVTESNKRHDNVAAREWRPLRTLCSAEPGLVRPRLLSQPKHFIILHSLFPVRYSIFRHSDTNGTPVFVPATIARRAAWVEAAKTSRALEPALASHASLTAADRFELRRIEELDAVPSSFNQFGVDVSGFTQVDAGTVRLASDHGSEWSALRIRVRK